MLNLPSQGYAQFVRTLAAIVLLVLSLTSCAAWAVTNLFHPHCIGLAVGWRQLGNKPFPLVGPYVHDWTDGEDEVWNIQPRSIWAKPDSPSEWVGNPAIGHRPIGFLGFQWIAYHATPTDRYFAIGFPFWAMMALSGYAAWRLRP